MAASEHRQPLPSQFQAELQRVTESEAFRHSDSLRRLLIYLGERAGSTNGLKEYTIGVEAFNKPTDYDPQQDPTVRVLASKLRHKLDEYYVKEGAHSPIRLEIPKGHYELRFQSRTEDTFIALQTSMQVRVLKWQRVSLALGIGVMLLLSSGIFWLLKFNPQKQVESQLGIHWTQDLDMIWRPFLEGDHPLLISLGTPLFIKLTNDFFRNPRINEWPEVLASDQIKLLQKSLLSDPAVPSYPYTGVGEATGAFSLCKLLHIRKPNLILKRSNALSWDDIRTSNTIFLGPPKFNQQLKDLPAEGGFTIERGAIRNPQPRQGEPEAYRSTWTDDHTKLLVDYALIYRLPGLHDHGEIMMLGSASTEASWAAVEYVTQPAYAKDLVERLRLPSGQLPGCFQVVLRVDVREQIPWKIGYVTHRLLAPPWKPAPANH